MTHLIVNVADFDAWQRHHSGGLLIPAHQQPKVLQRTREAAELECLRLSREHAGGTFVMFAALALAKRVPEASHVNLQGQVLRTSNVARLLPILDAPGVDDPDIPF